MNTIQISSLPALLGLIYLLCIALVIYHVVLCIKDHWRYYDFTKAIEGTPFIGRIYFGVLIIGWGSLVYMGAVGILLLIPDSYISGWESISIKRVLAVTFAFLSLYILKVLDSYAVNLVNKEVFEKEQQELEVLNAGLINQWGNKTETNGYLAAKKSEFLNKAHDAKHDEYSFMYSGLVDRCDEYSQQLKDS
ncbi:MAG: hypothetical protein HQL69_09415 [Magnetococcales bacterium]|nr:hypothetical protein [Magnetococcales bacterium]